MGQSAQSFAQLISIRRRERDRREADARLAQDALGAADAALETARNALEATARSCEKAQRERAQAPCDPLVAAFFQAEHECLQTRKEDAATQAAAQQEAQRALALARLERQRAQVRLNVLESEHGSMISRERRRSERKREDAQPLFGAAPC